MKPLIVGEVNPYSNDADNEFALYPYPRHASGGRLCFDVMGFREGHCQAYLDAFDRVNLCVGKWDLKSARFAAELIRESLRYESRSVLLLGANVCKAFGIEFCPFAYGAFAFGPVGRSFFSPFAILPHPAAHVSYWNLKGAYDRARRALVSARVLKEYPPHGQEEKGKSA
jgi:hypothetical protein